MKNDLRSDRTDFLCSLAPKRRETLQHLESMKTMLSLRSFNAQKEKEAFLAQMIAALMLDADKMNLHEILSMIKSSARALSIALKY